MEDGISKKFGDEPLTAPPSVVDYLLQAKIKLVEAYNEGVCYDDPITVDMVNVVWWSKTLQNWKAVFIVGDGSNGVIYEMTHDGNKSQTYVNNYRHTNSLTIPD